MVHILDTTWQNWIKENYLRGCNKPDMLSIMTKAGIPEETAQFNLTLYEASKNPKSNINTAFNELKQANPNKADEKNASYLFQLENNLETSDGKVMQVSMRCNAPDIVLLDDFMSDAECDELCALSKGSLSKSEVVDDTTGEGVKHKDRTSQGTFFILGQNALVEKIETRISEITGIPSPNGEGIQILNYIDGGEYKPHFDYFPDSEGGRSNMSQGGQRIITVIMYLNDVAAGGATIFPEINLNIYPKKGSALYFSYFNDAEEVDPLTLHGGAPVISGEKWIATKWLRLNTYR
ncbi:MAG: 2OG-Fe(II) oxygenase [Methylophilaceae bacterium]